MATSSVFGPISSDLSGLSNPSPPFPPSSGILHTAAYGQWYTAFGFAVNYSWPLSITGNHHTRDTAAGAWHEWWSIGKSKFHHSTVWPVRKWPFRSSTCISNNLSAAARVFANDFAARWSLSGRSQCSFLFFWWRLNELWLFVNRPFYARKYHLRCNFASVLSNDVRFSLADRHGKHLTIMVLLCVPSYVRTVLYSPLLCSSWQFIVLFSHSFRVSGQYTLLLIVTHLLSPFSFFIGLLFVR